MPRRRTAKEIEEEARSAERDCSWVSAVTQSAQLKEALEEACADGLTLEHFAMMTPMDLELLYEVDSATAERAIRKARDLLKDRMRPGIIARRPGEAQAAALKTGVAEFDAKTPWGGVPYGKITALAGEYGSGKSIFAMQVAAAALAIKHEVVYIDTENAFDDSMFGRIAKRFGVESTDAMTVITTADVYEMETLIRERLPPVPVIIVDSIIEPFRAEFKGREMLASRQQRLHYLIDLLRRRCIRYNTLVLLTNQVMDVPEAFAAGLKKPAGGNVLLHSANAIFMMVRPSKQKPEGYMWPLDVPGMSPEVKMRYEIRDDGLY